MAVNETIKSAFYRVYNSGTATWSRFAFWTKGSQVSCDDGDTVETKVGDIKGITTSTSVTETGYAADAKTVSEIKSNLGDISEITTENYNNVASLLQYYIDNGYLPNLNSVPLVPAMTSNTSPSGRVIVSSSSYSTNAYYAFDQNDSTVTKWYPTTTASNMNYVIGYEFTNPCKVNEIYHFVNSAGTLVCCPVYSDDGTNWVECGNNYTVSGLTTASSKVYSNVTEKVQHKYWGCKVKQLTNSVGSSCTTTEIQFYGK